MCSSEWRYDAIGTVSPATRVCSAPASSGAATATVVIPSSRHVRKIRTAISPRFATSSFETATAELYARCMGGPLRGLESEELNATLLEWGPGEGPAEMVNSERDVLLFVHEGSLTLTLDGVERELTPGDVVIVEKGMRRRFVAGPGGVRYLTAHRRRGGLQIASRPKNS